MKLLLDTHVVVWAAAASSRLSPSARELVADVNNERIVSAASAYEIEYKRLRDEALRGLPDDLETVRAALMFDWLPMTARHAILAARLPRAHGDPWDRLIVAQAQAEGLVLISADTALHAYDVDVRW